MARPRKPTEAKIATGNPGRRPLPVGEPPRVKGVVVPPDDMPEAVKARWRYFAALLEARDQLSADTAYALGQLAYCAQEVAELREKLQQEGRTQVVSTEGGASMIRANPAQAMFSDADRRQLAWLSQFGLTDATRSKVATGSGNSSPPDDPLAAYKLN